LNRFVLTVEPMDSTSQMHQQKSTSILFIAATPDSTRLHEFRKTDTRQKRLQRGHVRLNRRHNAHVGERSTSECSWSHRSFGENNVRSRAEKETALPRCHGRATESNRWKWSGVGARKNRTAHDCGEEA